MIRLTQTCLDPGNCLQTCIACILDLPTVRKVPRQKEDIGQYLIDLDGFLKPKGLRFEIVAPGEHYGAAYAEYVMCGPMRGPLGGICDDHCVVGREGRMVHDPYPTRPGLIRVEWLGLLVPR